MDLETDFKTASPSRDDLNLPLKCVGHERTDDVGAVIAFKGNVIKIISKVHIASIECEVNITDILFPGIPVVCFLGCEEINHIHGSPF